MIRESRLPSTFLNAVCMAICVSLIGTPFAGSFAAEEKTPKPEATAAKADVVAHPEPAQHGPDANHAEGSPGAHGAGGGEERLPIEWQGDLALWSLVTFVIFCIILRVAAWGPLSAALDSRESRIRADIVNAENARIKAEQMLADYQKKLATAQDEVLMILAEARRDAEHTRQEIMAQTEKDVAAMKDRAITEINQTTDKALEELFEHMSIGITSATEKIIGRALTDSDQDRLVNEALQEFSRKQAS